MKKLYAAALAATLVGGTLGAVSAAPKTGIKNVVLVHGAFADGSGWEAVADILKKMDVTTLFGRTKFSADAKDHGLQLGHQMVLAQWQKKGDKLVKEVIWPKEAKTADGLY